VTGQEPSFLKGNPNNPVEGFSWLDAVRFCNQLNEREGLKPFYEISGETVLVPDWNGTGYRLPTEGEWEYACRAGTATRFSFGDDEASLGEFAWFSGNSDVGTHEVGQKRANDFGLHDMQGNVWEWCWDWYAADYYKESPVDDPRGPSQASCRVFRGGGPGASPRDCRPACRAGGAPGNHYFIAGFRVARSPVWRLSSSYKGNGEKAGGAVGGALPAGTGVSWRSGAMSRAGHRCGEVSRPRHAYGRTSPLLSPFRVPGDLWSGVSAGSETHAERAVVLCLREVGGPRRAREVCPNPRVPGDIV